MSDKTSQPSNSMLGCDEKRITSHGIEFIRHGSCHQCGACGCDKEPCPHLIISDGTYWCRIYADRDKVCEQCYGDEGLTHQGCIVFPDNPWIRVVRNGECGYWFERADGSSMDDLPFLYDELYEVERWQSH